MLVTGAIKNLVQGVSTQNPKERTEGQVWTMRNMIPDPVEGAVKRPAVKHIQTIYADLPTLDTGEILWHTTTIQQGDFSIGTYNGRVILRNLETGEAVPVVQDPNTYQYFTGGIAASTNIGEYTLLAGTTEATVTQKRLTSVFSSAYINNTFTTSALVNRVVVFEVRQGAYSGIYTIRRSDGTSLATYTVPNGATSTDSVNVQPAFIAGQLYTQLLTTIGGAVGSGTIAAVQQQGASIAIFLDFQAVDEPAALFADDGAYNTRFIATDRFATNTGTLPSVGVQGHVVEIGDKNNNEGNYYLRFEHTQGSDVSGTQSLLTNRLRPGRWVEVSKAYASTGYSLGGILNETTLPSLLFVFNNVAYVGTGAYIASEILEATGVVITPLSWGSRVSGDDDSAADPFFVDSRIRWMGIFQDRLVIISDQAVSMSRTGDYLNFYRASVIDDLATDPINLTSTFDSSDVLVGAALLDKNLVVIGTKTHYAIVGRNAATPTNAQLLKTSAFESSPNVAPVSFGNLVYFSSASARNADILAIQPSDTTDSTYAYSVSSHVDGYIAGDLKLLTASTKLNLLFALDGAGVLYAYRTLFNQGERVLSSWFDFTFPSELKLVSIAVDNTKIRMLFSKIVGNKFLTLCGELDLDRVGYTGATRNRYLDFWVEHTFTTEQTDDSSARARAAFSKEAGTLVELSSNLAEGDITVTDSYDDPTFKVSYGNVDITKTYMSGVRYLTNFEPTMPLARNQDGEVTAIGSLVIAQMQVNYTVASDFSIIVKDKFREYISEHNARVVSAPDSVAGQDYVRDGFARFPVGSAELGCRVSIQSYNHYPLVLSSIDWKGQFYKRGASM
jgi:hypothetical protein